MSAISHDHKAIFVHIPKNAGISISRSLEMPVTGHGTLSQLLRGKPAPEGYYTFSVVRNPWDRLVAAYLYMKEGGRGGKQDRRLQQILANHRTFQHFLADLDGLLPVMNAACPHFLPQIHFHDYRINYVGHFERLEGDFAYICKTLGIERELRKDNMTEQNHYTTYYKSDEEIRKVGVIYDIDCRIYGYRYDIRIPL